MVKERLEKARKRGAPESDGLSNDARSNDEAHQTNEGKDVETGATGGSVVIRGGQYTLFGPASGALPKAAWDDGCLCCGGDVFGGGVVLLCERCDGEYHARCLSPPLRAVPEDAWFCPACERRGLGKGSKTEASPGAFESLPGLVRRALEGTRLATDCGGAPSSVRGSTKARTRQADRTLELCSWLTRTRGGWAALTPAHRVEILKELVDLESTPDCPIDFHGMCTHMADAQANVHRYTQRQFKRFRDVVDALRAKNVPVPCVHVENSQTLLDAHVGPERMRRLVGDGAGFCRVGGALYGQRHHAVLKPVLSLKAQVRHVHRLEAGMTVGYDRSWIAPRDSVVATLSIGFADGYPRSLSNQGVVHIRGHQFVVAGKVCMDMVMVDLGAKGGPGESVRVGDYATLWGDCLLYTSPSPRD